MKYQGHGLIWDPQKKKIVARFTGGFLETDDKRVAELCEKAGFSRVDAVMEEEEVSELDELREEAQSLGIDVNMRWREKTLREKIEEVKGE